MPGRETRKGKGEESLSSFAVSSEVPADVDTPLPPPINSELFSAFCLCCTDLCEDKMYYSMESIGSGQWNSSCKLHGKKSFQERVCRGRSQERGK